MVNTKFAICSLISKMKVLSFYRKVLIVCCWFQFQECSVQAATKQRERNVSSTELNFNSNAMNETMSLEKALLWDIGNDVYALNNSLSTPQRRKSYCAALELVFMLTCPLCDIIKSLVCAASFSSTRLYCMYLIIFVSVKVRKFPARNFRISVKSI